MRNDAIAIAAGRIAESKVAHLGSRERIAHHEAAHIVIAAALDLFPLSASIIRQPHLKVGRNGHLRGYAWYSFQRPENPLPADAKPKWPEESQTDRQRVARYALLLADKISWRGMLQWVHELRSITRQLVDDHWEQIQAVASGLFEFSEVTREEIEVLLKGGMREDELLDLIAAYRASTHGEIHVMGALAGSVATAMMTGGNRADRYRTWGVALRESARAAVGTALGLRLEEVSIVVDECSLGRCRFASDNGADRPDRRDVPDIGELQRDLPRLRQRAEQLVRAELYPIHKVAEALRTRLMLSGQEATSILDSARDQLARHVLTAPVAPTGNNQKEGVAYESSAVA
ncbi:MAG: hypothetical protein IT165_06660 [Bryobacterales bacterium]|nr:hypothetical protein [Bryobacterales bacterium]